MKRFVFLFALLALMGCGSSAATVPPIDSVESGGGSGGEANETASADAPPTWDELTGERLREFVTEGASAKLAEVQPDFDLAQIAAYRENPESAPLLGGRAVEQLMALAAVDVCAGNYAEAKATVRMVRERARNRNSAFAGTSLLAEASRREVGDQPAEAQQAAIEAVFRELPKQRFGGATVLYHFYQSPDQLTARLARTREQAVSLDTAKGTLYFEQLFPAIVENRPTYMAVVERVTAHHAAQPDPEAYTFPTVDLSGEEGVQPVRIAVWDVGTNPALFEEQLFVNPNETVNGQDDDGNGIVDDVHGIAADPDPEQQALVFQPSEAIVTEYTPYLQGIMDLRAGLATTEPAQAVIAHISSATTPERSEEISLGFDAVGEWAHGTHVAGIMVAGLPQAELAVFRSAWAGEARIYHHRGPTDEELAAERANVIAIAAFINTHEIKVVNASLGFSRDYVESELGHQRDLYPNTEAIEARAAEIQAHRAATWQEVFTRCPNTLFVVAAGNSNRDIVEYGDVPASQPQANVLVVGAVDRFGNWATFTNSNPEIVRVFDHGVAVDSLIPSGATLPLSGTSMASPNVANLAAKMLAVNPALTPAELMRVIEDTGDAIAPPFSGRIANEVRAIEHARDMAVAE